MCIFVYILYTVYIYICVCIERERENIYTYIFTYLHAYSQWDQTRDVTSQKTWNSISTKETEIGDKYVLSKQMG